MFYPAFWGANMFSFLAGGVRENQATPFLPIPLNPNSNKVRRPKELVGPKIVRVLKAGVY
jgi:hypothetical protein